MIVKSSLAAVLASGLVVPETPKPTFPKPAIIKPGNIEFSNNLLLCMPITMGMFKFGAAAAPLTYVNHFYNKNSSTISLSGTQAGDLVVVFSFLDGNGTPNLPTGYTDLRGGNGGTAAGYGLSYKVLTGADTQITGLQSTSDSGSIAVLFRNVHASTPIGGNAGAQSASDNANVNPPSITANGSASIVVAFGALDDDLATLSTVPSGYTALTFPTNNYYQVGSSGSGGTMVAAYKGGVGAGTEDPAAFVMSSSDAWAAATVEIRGQ